jgi:hypothetical protein
MTATMEWAEARFSASAMMSSSMRFVFASGEVDCTMKDSRPRTFSPISTWISPSEKRPTVHSARGRPSSRAIASASLRLELPAKTR